MQQIIFRSLLRFDAGLNGRFCYYPVMRLRPFQLARISGIPLMVDYSWLLVAGLHFWLVARFYLPQQVDEIGVWEAMIFAVLMTVLMFGSIIVHELAHALVAKFEHIRTIEILLHIFGGYARLAIDPQTAMAELRIAIAGPVASFLLGVIFMLCLLVTQATISGQLRYPLRAMFMYLFTGNVALAMFNLIPGLPLDGGRVLRAFLWHRNKDIVAATLTAKRLGVALAYMLASYGLYRAIWWRDPFTAVWMILIAFFLKKSAEEDYHYRKLQAEQNQPAGVTDFAADGTVAKVMSRPPISVSPEMLISDFIDQILAKHRYTSYPVANDGRLHGMLVLEKMRVLPQEAWDKTIVREVMQPIDDSLFVPMRASLEHATKKLKESPLHRLAVIDGDGFLVGYLSPTDLERAA